jgi:hypothetical protein
MTSRQYSYIPVYCLWYLFLQQFSITKGHLQAKILEKHTKKLIYNCILLVVGRDSSVGIATRYGMDGLEIESRWGRDFSHLSRPAVGANQPPVQWVPGLSRG